jgi:hypothetical protein
MSDFKGWLTAKITCEPSLQGSASAFAALIAEQKITASLSGNPSINETVVLDVFNYILSEDRVHFIVAENGDRIGFY